jgi:hypothetical protein
MRGHYSMCVQVILWNRYLWVVISLKYFSSTPKVCEWKYARTEQYDVLGVLLGGVCL